MRLALLIISIIFLSCCRIAHAQIENLSVQYTGIWSGSYICGSTESGITLVLTPDGPNSVNGTLSYYPLANRGDVTPGSHHVRIKIKDNSFVGMYGAWIQRPPKHRPLEFTGLRISEDQLSFDINSPSCKTATLTKFEGPPDRVPRVVEKEDRTAPKVAKSAQPQQNAAGSSFAGRWEGPATCLKGPHKFILSVLPAIDKSGFNASLTVVSMAEVKADDVTVQGMFINDSDPRSPIRFEPDRHAKLPPRQSAPSFKGRADGKGQLRGASHESGCQVVSLKRLSQDPYGEIANRVVPPDLTGFLGHWDGAIFDREGRAFQVSFSITPAQSGSVNRMFDVTVELNNRVGKIALAKVPNGSLNIVNILGQGQLPVALRGHLLTDLVRSSGRDHFVFATQGDANGTGIVWRRPPARGDISLKRECEEDVIPFATARNHAREIARDLRMEYFPALSKYDEAAASMREALKAYSDKGQTMAAGSFALLAAQCMLTSPNFYFYLNRELMAGIVDMEAIEKARLGFASSKKVPNNADFIVSTGGNTEMVGEPLAVETKLPAIVATMTKIDDMEDLLTLVAEHASDFERMRPSELAKGLQPISSQLFHLEQAASQAAVESRKSRAKARSPGSFVPGDSFGPWTTTFNELMAGTKTRFDGDEISFWGGFIAGAMEYCGLPASLAERASLSGFLLQATDRAMLGDRYATGDLLDSLKSSLGASSSFSQGSQIPEELGCNSLFLRAALDNLSDAAEERLSSGAGRASLFIRSCALDREERQCQCMAREMQAALPRINDMRFDRTQISSVIERNPLTALKLATNCGVHRY